MQSPPVSTAARASAPAKSPVALVAKAALLGAALGAAAMAPSLSKEDIAARDDRNRAREDARIARIAAASAREELLAEVITPAPVINSLKLAASAYGIAPRKR